MKVIGIAFLIASIVTGCCNNPKNKGNAAIRTYELATVVEAVQYSIDKAAQDNAWGWSEVEQNHWKKACSSAQKHSAKACAVSGREAEPLCENACGNIGCSPVDEAWCKSLLDGSARAEKCELPVDAGFVDWCDASKACLESKANQKRICDASTTIQLPKLKSATLTLKVEQGKKKSAGISLFFVTFGGSKTSSSASTTTLTLTPRVRDTDYGSVPPILNKNMLPISEEAKILAGDLSEMIIAGVRAGTRESADDDEVVTPPLFLSSMKFELALSVDKGGKFAIGKEWDSVPASIEAGTEGNRKATNSLVIEYSRSGQGKK